MKQEGKWVVVAKGTQEVNEYLDIDDEGGNDYFLDKLLKMVLFLNLKVKTSKFLG